MTKKTIKHAYQSIRPDDEARARMLENILSGASELPPERIPMKNRNNTLRRAIPIAVVISLFLVLGIAAYAAYQYSLQDLVLTPTEPVAVAGENTSSEETTETYDVISLQGFADSPNFKAAQEYRDYLASYDFDWATLENDSYECPAEYMAYTCYSQKMQDKIDEICDKYGLNLLGPNTMVNARGENLSSEEIFTEMGLSDLRNPAVEANHNIVFGYYYPEGTFQIEGDITLTGETAPWPYTVSYELRRVMKTSFDHVPLGISGGYESFEEWTYTTPNGTEVLLALGPEQALVIADLEESFVVVNMNDFYDSSFDVNDLTDMNDYSVEVFSDRATLEAFADAFDFSQLS